MTTGVYPQPPRASKLAPAGPAPDILWGFGKYVAKLCDTVPGQPSDGRRDSGTDIVAQKARMADLVESLERALGSDKNPQVVEDIIVGMEDPIFTEREAMHTAQQWVHVGRQHLAERREAWILQRDRDALQLTKDLEQAIYEASVSQDSQQRLRAINSLGTYIGATTVHLNQIFTRCSPCPSQDPQLQHAFAVAKEWLESMEWTNTQRRVWLQLAQTMLKAVETNADGVGAPLKDAERAHTRTKLRECIQEARSVLMVVPEKVVQSKDHTMLKNQSVRASEMAMHLENFWQQEWLQREASRERWVVDSERGRCTSCKCPLGWLRVRRRHHCRQCGDIFCSSCLGRRKVLTALAYASPEKVCNRCYGTQLPPAPALPLPESLRASGASSPRKEPPAAHTYVTTPDSSPLRGNYSFTPIRTPNFSVSESPAPSNYSFSSAPPSPFLNANEG